MTSVLLQLSLKFDLFLNNDMHKKVTVLSSASWLSNLQVVCECYRNVYAKLYSSNTLRIFTPLCFCYVTLHRSLQHQYTSVINMRGSLAWLYSTYMDKEWANIIIPKGVNKFFFGIVRSSCNHQRRLAGNISQFLQPCYGASAPDGSWGMWSVFIRLF